MKKRYIRFVLSALNILILQAISTNAGKQVGRGELELQVSAAAYSTDNLNGNALSEGDEFLTFTPTITYTVDTSRINIESSLSLPVKRYSSQSVFDSEDIIFSVTSKAPFLPSSPLYGNVSFSYADTVDIDYLINARIASKTTNVGANGGIKLGQRFDLRGGADYNERLTDGITGLRSFSDYQTKSVYGGLQINEILGSANGYVDYRFQKRETIGQLRNDGIDDIDEGIRFGLNGQILPERLFPKLEADLSFGFAKSDDFRDSSNNDDFLIISGSLEYPATQKTNVAFNVSRNLRVTNLDQNVESFQMSLAINQTPRQNLNFNWSVGYEVNDFGFSQSTTIPDRKDTTLFASGAVNLIFTIPWFATAGIDFRDTESNDLFRDYSSTTVFLSVNRIF